MSKSKDKEGGVVLSFGGHWVSWAHTIAAYSMSSGKLGLIDGNV